MILLVCGAQFIAAPLINQKHRNLYIYYNLDCLYTIVNLLKYFFTYYC